MSIRKRYFFALAAAVITLLVLPGSAIAAPTVTQVTTGLDSPRGIAFFNGRLVVAQAGHGGSDCFNAPGVPFPICVGASSSITWVNTSNGAKTPLVSGLFSVSLGPEGTIGVSGLSARGEQLFAQIGSTAREAPPNIAIAQAEAGQLLSVRANGAWTKVAPVGTVDFDYTTQFPEPNPAVCGQCNGTQEHDANPYGVLASDEGVYVADAGANTLDRIGDGGKVRILLRDGWRDPNPNNFPSDSVPTCVAQTEDGLIIGELSGRVLKVHDGGFTVINNPLFTHITGCTTDHNGNVYFVNMFGRGAPFTPPPASMFFIGNVVQYNADSGKASVLVPGLQFPNMDTIGPDGNLYVTVGSICGATPDPMCNGATGGVIKVTLPHQNQG